MSGPVMLLGFRPGVSAVLATDDRVEVTGPFGGVTLPAATPGVWSALQSLREGAEEPALAERVRCTDGLRALPVLYFWLERLDAVSALTRTLVVHGRPLVTVEPLVGNAGFPKGTPAPGQRYMLSRFAYLRRDAAGLVLETPLARARLVFHDWRGPAIVSGFAAGAASDELSGQPPGLEQDEVIGIAALLLGLDALTEIDGDHGTAEDGDPALLAWEAHDLWFHARSRRGRCDAPYGATYRLLGKMEPAPAVKPPPGESALRLYRPDIEELAVSDPSLTRVIEDRRSGRRHGSEPITAQQVGEFLYRVARLRRLENTEYGQVAFYPYPSGGASSELTLYAFIDRCQGLRQGGYQYGPDTHRLHRVCDHTDGMQRLLREAAAAMKVPSIPQVLLVLAARFQRVSWKYERMAYALMLKHVGVLYQQMSLVATAMGLAGCAIGGGDSDAFCAAVGTRYYEETSVGEFALGSAPPGETPVLSRESERLIPPSVRVEPRRAIHEE